MGCVLFLLGRAGGMRDRDWTPILRAWVLAGGCTQKASKQISVSTFKIQKKAWVYVNLSNFKRKIF